MLMLLCLKLIIQSHNYDNEEAETDQEDEVSIVSSTYSLNSPSSNSSKLEEKNNCNQQKGFKKIYDGPKYNNYSKCSQSASLSDTVQFHDRVPAVLNRSKIEFDHENKNKMLKVKYY